MPKKVRNERPLEKDSASKVGGPICAVQSCRIPDCDIERLATEQRQKAKAKDRKAQARASSKATAKAKEAAQKRAQTTRSAVFAAARKGEAAKVKKGIWEDDVDAAGGEVLDGHLLFVPSMPSDLKETLLHIATKKGDAELVVWLDSHSKSIYPCRRHSF